MGGISGNGPGWKQRTKFNMLSLTNHLTEKFIIKKFITINKYLSVVKLAMQGIRVMSEQIVLRGGNFQNFNLQLRFTYNSQFHELENGQLIFGMKYSCLFFRPYVNFILTSLPSDRFDLLWDTA